MAELYTPQRRAEIQENLLTFLQTDEQIVGVITVGSGAQGFRDSYSDVNLLIVVSDDATTYGVYSKWKTRLVALYPRIAGFEEQDTETFRYVCLLDNYLSLDLQFTKLRRLMARHKPWHVAFDRSGKLPELLDKAYAAEQDAAPLREYHRIVETVWQPVLKCAIALRRDETWRALYLLEYLRSQAVQLAGINHGIDTRDFADVDRLPEMFLVHLRHTIPTSTSSSAIRRALRTTVVLLFGEITRLEERLALPSATALRQQILNYLDAYA